jgi:hypothetical protein
VISGAGQLGSRYLQGMVKCSLPLSIYVVDLCSAALERSIERWKEAGGHNTFHRIHFENSNSNLPKLVDIAIVATRADVRVGVLNKLISQCQVRYLVLEKILATTLLDLEDLLNISKRVESVWVNTPRRMMSWHQELIKLIVTQQPSEIYISGGAWGLACNSIHFIDFANFIFNENLISVNTDNLNSSWYESKRSGFFEINGKLIAKFSDNKTLLLECLDSSAPINIYIKTNKGEWLINESIGQAIDPEGTVIEGYVELQSEMTARLLESILLFGICELPSLDKSVALHKPFLQSMLAHWNQSHGTSDINLRVT